MRSRHGFILAAVLVVAAAAGALALLAHQHMRQRSVQVAQGGDQASARFLARGALDCLKFALREACAPPPPGVQVTTSGNDLYALLLCELPAIRKEAAGARAFLDRRLGAKALEPVDRLVAKLPSASVELSVAFEPGTTAPVGLVQDPVVKRLRVRLGAKARVRFAQVELSVDDEWQVHSQLPLAGKFTFACANVRGVADQKLHDDGRAYAESPASIVLINHPKDGDALAADPFARGAEKPLVDRSVPASALVTAHADRGLVLLSGPPEAPAVYLPVGAGGAPAGELSTVWRPDSGQPAPPFAKPVADQPSLIKSFAPVDPRPPNAGQAAWIQGAVLGFSTTLDASLLDAAPDGGPASELASRLKVFGTGAMPSPTAVIGPVWRVLAAVSSVAIDRDATEADESAQAAAAGRPLPVRDGREPFLAWAGETAYQEDLDAELSAAEPAYKRLRLFGSEGQHGYVDNVNALVDGVPVASEAGLEKIALDLTVWKYANLFAGYEEYKRVMSRHLAFPANWSLALAGMPSEQAMDTLRLAAFGKAGLTGAGDWLVSALTLTHRDALHREAALAASGGVYLASGRTGAAELWSAVDASAGERSAFDVTVHVKGQRGLEERFIRSGQLDLGGLTVVVDPVEGLPAGLAFDHPLAVRAGSGGVLVTPSLACPALLNPGEPQDFAPLSIVAGELVLTGKGPFEAVLKAGRIRIDADVDCAVVKGALVMGGVPEGLPVPLVVTWDPRLDPTGEAAAAHYRVAHARQRTVYRAGPLK